MELALRNATKKYTKTLALDSVSFAAGPGELIAVLGVNGAGKSTLLRAISGAIALDSGELFYDNSPFSYDNLEQRRSFMFIPDDPPLLFDETVLRNISIFLTQYQKTEVEGMAVQVAQLLEDLEIKDKAPMPVIELSRGQTYKAGLAILAAVDPPFWYLDEPFASGMDAVGLSIFKRLVATAVANGRTVIYSTQLVELAEQFATRICILHQGKIHAEAPPDELASMSKTDDLIAKLVSS